MWMDTKAKCYPNLRSLASFSHSLALYKHKRVLFSHVSCAVVESRSVTEVKGQNKSLVQTRIVALKLFCCANRNASTLKIKKIRTLNCTLKIFYTNISKYTPTFLSETENGLMLPVIFTVNKGGSFCFASLPRGLWDGHACPPASVGQMAEPFLSS